MMKLTMRYEVPLPVLLAMLLLLQGAWAQNSSCLAQLAPCLKYLNGTKDVPDTCCDPLKTVIKSNPACLCSMISNKGSRRAEKAGINVSEAQELPGRCGQHVNPFGCLTGSKNLSSAKGFLLRSQSLMVAVVLSTIVQILWVSILY